VNAIVSDGPRREKAAHFQKAPTMGVEKNGQTDDKQTSRAPNMKTLAAASRFMLRVFAKSSRIDFEDLAFPSRRGSSTRPATKMTANRVAISQRVPTSRPEAIPSMLKSEPIAKLTAAINKGDGQTPGKDKNSGSGMQTEQKGSRQH